ncbi:MAG: bifunctional 4-hydroxy-2-oxoglutarate aldolase/2-dehydro-3-deoxy-phosphogluconate aldolase [Oscillospiraceae bacterium]|nr:bifunctional 4-hydroxy-2-oxoglutarate aldolase/2-dehydro-3-deoxy-phosphogluconate aldolase [Oscillospiraceae bacterium]
MTVIERLKESIVVPVVVIENEKDAIPTAKALLAGGINTMEITFRTACAPECIKAVTEACPEMLVGAGTVLNVEQAKLAVKMGAKFIVSPGFDADVVDWCIANDITVTPGCVTPTEIMAAVNRGLKIIKFFPANVYGGLSAMKNLSAPFVGIQFLPTGGVNTENIKEYVDSPFVFAVGGSWVCPKADISAGNFEKITDLCKNAIKAAKEA